MAEIITGNDVIDRPSAAPANWSYIDKLNPCNGDGVITEIQIWCNSNMTGVKVGMFEFVSGTTYKCISLASIGSVTAGALRTFSVELAATNGSFIGFYNSTGFMERTDAGGNIVLLSGDHFVEGTSVSYGTTGTRIFSIKGIGTTVGGDSLLEPFSENVDFKIGIPIQTGISIISVLFNNELDETPFIKSVESGSEIIVEAPALWNGRTFGYWKIFKLDNTTELNPNRILIKNITEQIEIRAIYVSQMFFEGVEYYVGPIVPKNTIQPFSEDVDYTIL